MGQVRKTKRAVGARIDALDGVPMFLSVALYATEELHLHSVEVVGRRKHDFSDDKCLGDEVNDDVILFGLDGNVRLKLVLGQKARLASREQLRSKETGVLILRLR